MVRYSLPPASCFAYLAGRKTPFYVWGALQNLSRLEPYRYASPSLGIFTGVLDNSTRLASLHPDRSLQRENTKRIRRAMHAPGSTKRSHPRSRCKLPRCSQAIVYRGRDQTNQPRVMKCLPERTSRGVGCVIGSYTLVRELYATAARRASPHRLLAFLRFVPRGCFRKMLLQNRAAFRLAGFASCSTCGWFGHVAPAAGGPDTLRVLLDSALAA